MENSTKRTSEDDPDESGSKIRKVEEGLLSIKSAISRWCEYGDVLDSIITESNEKYHQGEIEQLLCNQLTPVKTALARLVKTSQVLREITHDFEQFWIPNNSLEIDIEKQGTYVDRNWQTLLNVLRNREERKFDHMTFASSFFTSMVEKLDLAIGRWLAVPHVKPDSERPEKLPTNFTSLSTGSLHYVNRLDATMNLFHIHLETYIRRTKTDAHSGDDLIFPLMDSLFGMGKTTFGERYLGLVSHFSKQLTERYREFRIQDIEGVLLELKRARTLLVQFGSGALFDTESREQNFIKAILQRLRNEWGVEISPVPRNYSDLVSLIPKPIFFVFDEIGAAFVKSGTNIRTQREMFYEFVYDVCTTLAKSTGCYSLLCGRADFLWNVGATTEDRFVQLSRGSPGVFKRVNLNPIRESKIKELLEHSLVSETSLATKLQTMFTDLSLSDIVRKLYVVTAGHPRSLLARLKSDDPFSSKHDFPLLLREVRLAVQKYPAAIRKLFNDRNHQMNLTDLIGGRTGYRTTKEYLATRIHAGYGDDISNTMIYIPPLIEEYLVFCFLPLTDFLLAYDELLKRRHVSRTDLFEEVLVKWFQSAFSNSEKTCGQVMEEFCPPTSILFGKSWVLDVNKLREGSQILSRNLNSHSESTISVSTLAENFCDFLTDATVDMYFPAPRSASPDIIIIPPLNTDKLIIGVQAKCLSNQHPRIGKSTVIQEARNFHRIISEVRSSFQETLSAVLIMCCTCSYTQRDFGNFHNGIKAMVWDNDEVRTMGIEVILINLSTPYLRSAFFGKPIPEASREASLSIIERIIEYSSRFTPSNSDGE